MNPGKVSVIIPSYNYAHYLGAAVESVMNQSYGDWEIVIVDDESTDDTPRVAQGLVGRAPGRIQYHRVKNGGVSAARNFGIEHSSGEFIMPLDADDMLMPNALEEFVKVLRADSKAGYAFSNLENVNGLSGDLRIWEQGPFIRGRIVLENTAASASMWRRSLFQRGVRYRPLIFEDWDLWLQIVAHDFHGAYVPEPLFKYRLHVSGRTSRNRYLYFPALLQVMLHNPSLYDEGLVTWAKSCLAFSPECWKKSTVVFLPLPGSPEYSSFSGPMAALAEEFLRERHFVVSLGDYTGGSAPREGLALLSLITHDLEAIFEKLGMLGPSVLVFSALPEWMNKGIRGLKNVAQVLSFDVPASPASIVGAGSVRPFESGYMLSRGPVGLLGERVVMSGPEVVRELVASTADRAVKRKAREDEFWGAMKRLDEVSGRDGASTWELLRAQSVVIIPVKDPPLSSLEQCLHAIRRADSSVRIVVSDHGSADSLVRERLPLLCAQYSAEYLLMPTREKYSRARAFNVAARQVGAPWSILIPPELIVSPEFFGCCALYIAATEPRSVLVGEARYLPPFTEREVQRTFDDLASLGGFRPSVTIEYAIIPRSFLDEIGGLCEELKGEGPEIEELDWRIKAEGARLVWLPRGQVLRQWSLLVRSVKQDEQNSAIVARMKQFPRMHSDLWGRVREEERRLFSSLGPLKEEVEKVFTPSQGLSAELRTRVMSTEDRVECLVAWGRHCLMNDEYVSARPAFEDALLLAPRRVDVLVGLGHCAARRGGVASMGHYATLALRLDPSQSDARNMMAHLEKTTA